MWILVGRPCGRAVHDGDALAHSGNRLYVQEKSSETPVSALYAIGIVPYWPNHAPHARADVVYTRENEWYGPDHERYGPDYDLHMLDDEVSRVRDARGAPVCRLL